MTTVDAEKLLKYISKVFKPHPWHGLEARPKGDESLVNAYIEIVPTDRVKYEIDKDSGYLMVDRPQKFSNIVPSLYGFIPRTYSGEKLAKYTNDLLGRTDLVGDSDPLDLCVLTEKPITHGDLLLKAVPIGGFRMLDDGEVDDKIIAVLKDDPIYSMWEDVSACPESVINSLRHYFLTYKEIPGSSENQKIEITHTYSRKEAETIIALGCEDYQDKYGFVGLDVIFNAD
ncbi:inorganic pyrophosphatase [Pseudobacteriovorax antillogorgiicola]|uniref:inorganic diphosphatase n=1 Tax=Pseudobacteriovorax antillogorgiicola TaxID=1513793 RepID=A0A1Y6CJT3_9BACT|nr:inorganic pyrophosphatase [Pseudobacteriovorax antillogorgiicola]TCS47682.1 inorganic pyrophosphatase [Pseudobacteriovorax antillogorgiicola]SMF59580.1 inorganic pyrophosphatase [Pseudobacteriovorax antillogorgiicola]